MDNQIKFEELKAQISTCQSSFQAMINNGQIFVDKTDYIYDLCVDDNFKFLSRPRRFGKSTIVSILEELFTHGVKPYDGHESYFKGLKIEKLWKDPKTYKVIHLDFSAIKLNSLKSKTSFDKNLNYVFANATKDFYSDYDFTKKAYRNLQKILANSSIDEYVILIDEYDYPLTFSMDDQEMFRYISNELNAIYASIKGYAGSLRFLFVTGITRYKDESSFTFGSVIKDVSYMPGFATIAGFTKAEIKKYFRKHLKFAITKHSDIDKSKISSSLIEEFLDKIEDNYNGYFFDYDCSEKVFRTWDIINFFSNSQADFDGYWFESGGIPPILVQNINKIQENLIAIISQEKNIFVSEDDFEYPTSLVNMNAAVLLYQTGYLTLAEPKNEYGYFLKFPNKKIKDAIQRLIYK